MTLRFSICCGLAALLAGCAPMLPPVSDQNLASIAESRPWATLPDLVSGRALYAGRCGSCHALPAVRSHSVEEWPEIVDVMAPKARLDSSESRRLLDWVLSEHAQGR